MLSAELSMRSLDLCWCVQTEEEAGDLHGLTQPQTIGNTRPKITLWNTPRSYLSSILVCSTYCIQFCQLFPKLKPLCLQYSLFVNSTFAARFATPTTFRKVERRTENSPPRYAMGSTLKLFLGLLSSSLLWTGDCTPAENVTFWSQALQLVLYYANIVPCKAVLILFLLQLTQITETRTFTLKMFILNS